MKQIRKLKHRQIKCDEAEIIFVEQIEKAFRFFLPRKNQNKPRCIQPKESRYPFLQKRRGNYKTATSFSFSSC